jgi:hypothetical protein
MLKPCINVFTHAHAGSDSCFATAENLATSPPLASPSALPRSIEIPTRAFHRPLPSRTAVPFSRPSQETQPTDLTGSTRAPTSSATPPLSKDATAASSAAVSPSVGFRTLVSSSVCTCRCNHRHQASAGRTPTTIDCVQCSVPHLGGGFRIDHDSDTNTSALLGLVPPADHSRLVDSEPICARVFWCQ